MNIDFLNLISEDDLFKATSLYQFFKKDPIGFIDVGAAGGIHEAVLPIASIVNCLGFEPNPSAFRSVEYFSRSSSFARLTVSNAALGEREAEAEFYVTRSEVNSSLRRPDEDFVERYGRSGFDIDKTLTVKTTTLDNAVQEVGTLYPYPAEFIKLDCQGGEYDILRAAEGVLAGQCLGLLCEVEFCRMYSGQKTFAEIDRYLRDYGFVLYGLTPNYISKQYMDRTKYDTNERLLWADALYFKDPLDPVNRGRLFPQRSIYILIILSLALQFIDFAYELIDTYITDKRNKSDLLNLAKKLAEQKKAGIEKNALQLINQCRRQPLKAYLYAKKFIDDNKGNDNIDHIEIDQDLK